MKTKALLKSFTFSLIAIFSVSAHAQISTNELPPSFSSSLFSTRSSDVINLSVPDVAEALHEDSLFVGIDIPYRVGLPLSVSYNLQNSGHWQVMGDSIRVWRLQLHASGAKAMTISYDKFWMPEGAKFFIYNVDKTFCIGAFTSFNNKGTQENPVDFATGFVAGEDIVLEYYEPIGVETGVISVQKIGYIYKNVLAAQGNIITRSMFNTSLPCNVNVNCPLGIDWQKEKRAVACIYNASTLGVCSGALINSTSQKDYFLSADHCFLGYDSQGKNQLNQLIFYWNYESPDCSDTNISNSPSSTGAKLIANSAYTDFALLELVESVKNINGYIPYYLGWTRNTAPAANAVGIHHPRGDIKKISVENNAVKNYSKKLNWTDENGNIISTTMENTHWETIFDIGTTERGSSGSPLMNQNHLVVGQLHGGEPGCAPATRYYGRFDKSWDYGSTATRRLKDWLDSSNAGMMQLEARELIPEIVGTKFICDSSTYYIKNLPANAMVIWEYPTEPNSAPRPQFYTNYPVPNQCTIKNKYYYPYNANLIAKIVYNGNTLWTLSKEVISDTKSYPYATYIQEACTFYGVNHPSISGRVENSTFVHQGCMVRVIFNSDYDKDIYYDSSGGITHKPLFWNYHRPTKTLEFQLPYRSGGLPFAFILDGEGVCKKKRIIFFSYTGNGNAPVSAYSLKVLSPSENIKEIQLVTNDEIRERSNLDWSLEVYNVAYGTKVLEVKRLTSLSYIMDTSGWTSGMYVTRVIIGDKVLTEKIAVGK
ncbi:trypsin-like serine peptidase [Bacteroides oleiciplenus]|uniref:Peptidase S1 domain-containing protein n=1 Tax=Bacteroides oleiciplenus YIT 12058 TaxID=742727 RepID=K9DRE7_9BACE|nr:trypsin-like peptidase domain-containing protein [Bacteroides oleiciplenus]EKU87414.1 hypothetical protein HMPREF9447_05297 [Bacteroides oleiciplenus YIT 12058]